jgi:pimeloyl-ACP methyl ester carboxylesterase
VQEGLGGVVAPALPGDPREALEVIDAAVEPGDVVIGHSMGGVLVQRLARERPRALRAAVLTGCFFAPARNGRGLGASVLDYAAHRVRFVRERRRGRRGERSGRALASLVGLAVRSGGLPGALTAATNADVLVVHACDDHHVPVDFAIAGARSAGWDLRLLGTGGHHAHVSEPEAWLGAVSPWLAALPS